MCLEEVYQGIKRASPSEAALAAIELARAFRWAATEGSFERARSLCEEAVSLATAEYGDNHPITSEAKCELGVLHHYVDCDRAYQFIKKG